CLTKQTQKFWLICPLLTALFYTTGWTQRMDEYQLSKIWNRPKGKSSRHPKDTVNQSCTSFEIKIHKKRSHMTVEAP
ncbi:MAG: hypothetical protein QF473_40925, partial [Planctomycetota bacterium]|nr:hypothetical protein [Planctomycetota bacterium]